MEQHEEITESPRSAWMRWDLPPYLAASIASLGLFGNFLSDRTEAWSVSDPWQLAIAAALLFLGGAALTLGFLVRKEAVSLGSMIAVARGHSGRENDNGTLREIDAKLRKIEASIRDLRGIG